MSETTQPAALGAAPAIGVRKRRRRWTPPPGSLGRHADFNRLWFGQSVSVLGSELTTLALPLTAIITLNASATQVGLLNTFGTAATLTLMLFAGVLVDRLRRRRVMLVCDVLRGLAVATIPVMALTGHLTIWVMYGVTLVTGGLTVIFELAYFAHLPALVGKDQLVAANSRLQGTESVGGIVGTNLGGTLVTVMRPALALAIDAASFFVSAISLSLIRKPDPKPEIDPEAPKGVRGVMQEIGEGMRPNYKNPYLRPLTFNSASTNFLSQIILTLFILYAARDLHLSPVWIGVIYGAGSVGGVIGALTVGWATRRFGFGRTLVGSMMAFRCLMFAPLIRGPQELEIPLLCLCWMVTVFGVVVSNVSAGTLRQVVVPSELQGRVLAAHRLLGYGTLPLAALLAGVFGSLFGVHATMLASAIVFPLTLGWVAASPLPKLKRAEDAGFGEGGAIAAPA